MIPALLLGIASGFVLSIPPGPLGAAVTKHTVSYNFRSGFMVALGGGMMDTVYVLIAAFASSAIVTALVDLLKGHALVLVAFQVACIVVLLVMGIRYIRHKQDPGEETRFLELEETQEAKAQRLGYSSPFFVGVLIAVANLASPMFIPSMISVVSYIQANGLLDHKAGDNVAYAFGFGIGTACWFALVARMVIKYRTKFSMSVLSNIYTFAGGTFLLCACVLAYNVIMSTDWSTLR
jgi:threonine/homoserine/homoserine lactone efflux protein